MATEAAKAIRDKAAICGVSALLGDYPDRTALSLAVEAFQLALDDAGMSHKDIDGIMCLSYGADYDRFLEATGVETRYAFQGWTHGRFISPTVQQAAMTIAAGLADAIAIVHGKKHKAYGQPVDHEMWRQGLGPHGESPAYGAFGPALAPALAAQRYFHVYGGSADDLGYVCTALRESATLNPIALRKTPMSMDDYLNSRWIIQPLRLFDCCQNNDAAACIILTSAERARDLKKKPVYVSGFQGVHAGRQRHNFTLPGLGVAQQDDFSFRPAKEDLYVYEMADIERKDVDMIMTYDAFSPVVLFVLERFGFCGPGEAIDFIKSEGIGVKGRMPVNTSGGLLSEGHAAGWNLFAECARQLRGEAGERQVKDCEVVQYGSFLGESIIFRN
ncbi:thiolase family protein [Bradyrhizobium sp. LHD-71]|uniref:thiolase family protein n=1 Tax=Bradyrhizobium sp. LHD-71 TaxID=3072141 RepID=UPI00281031DB|nr:thiolase family protein [Bradyrhizobium sp. LHD-71]MDQ8731456.1 thiolase family protein [Bradyrhizobium sp. LHD-71]